METSDHRTPSTDKGLRGGRDWHVGTETENV